jgi:alpha,alpha-trehalose phosphorylase
MFLLDDQFSEEQKGLNYEYYDLLTTGDSSLSGCVQSILAAEIGNVCPRIRIRWRTRLRR